MQIGQLAAQFDLNTKTIRYYESVGLLPTPHETKAGTGNTTPTMSTALASSAAPNNSACRWTTSGRSCPSATTARPRAVMS